MTILKKRTLNQKIKKVKKNKLLNLKKKKHEKYISNVATDIFFTMHAVFLKILFFLKIIIINLFQFFSLV